MKPIRSLALGLIVLVSALLPVQDVYAQACQLDNDALQAMPKVQVLFTSNVGEESKVFHQVQAKLASNNTTRAAGFQYVCASVIAAEPILFLFPHLVQAKFHMHNVVAPIDIVFIREDGRIDSSHAMQPYPLMAREKPLYGSQRMVIAALETRPGYFVDHNINANTVISWQLEPTSTE